MKGHKHFTLLLVLALGLALVAAACGPAATPTPGPTPTPKIVKETVVVEKEKARPVVRLSGWTASPEEENLLRASLYEFSQKYPDVVVKYEPITADYWPKMLTMVTAGTEPDIYYMDIFQFPFYASKEVLLPQDDLMAKTGTKKEDFIPSLLNAFTWKGKVYGIPKDFNTLALFYNKKLFKDAGLKGPTDDWTWTDLKAAAAKLTDKAKKVYGVGVPADPGRFPIFVFQNGGQVMNKDFTDTLLDSPEAIAAAEFYTGLRKEGSGAIPSDVGEGWQGTAFGKGSFAMVYEGGWMIPYLKAQFPNTEYGAVLPPAGPKSEGNLIFTVSYVISKKSKNPEAAWTVINYLTGPENQTTVLKSGFALPSRKALLNDPYFKDHPISATVFRGAEIGTPFMWGLKGSDVNEQMGQGLERVYLKGQSPADAMKEAATKIRAKLKE
ncbi:MAG: ABC transporter substrate-binding protein [Chloroflexota bacterium]